MSPSKSVIGRKPDRFQRPPDSRILSETLRNQRLAHEQAQKDAGVWGEMSVGAIERAGAVFVLVWKGAQIHNVHKLSLRRPKEISKPEHEALCAWLKAGSYDGFTQRIAAWNVTEDEARRIKLDMIIDLTGQGKRIVNPPEAPPAHV